MYVWLSKILPLFVMPLGVAIVFGLLALVLVAKGAKKTGFVFLVLGLVYLSVMSMPVVSHRLILSIESEYPPQPLERIPSVMCGIVLGGTLSAPEPPRIDIDMTGSVDRVYKAAELYREGKARFLIVSGGLMPWSRDVPSEAELIRELLTEWGVPRDAVILEASSMNTRENALYSKFAAESMNCGESLLITSAAHMPRSVAAFEAVGMAVVPVSTDVRAADTARLTPMDFIPQASALDESSDALRELIGRWVYRLRGWG